MGAPGGERGAAFVFLGPLTGTTTGAIIVANWVVVDEDGDEEDMLEDSRFGAALTAGDFNGDMYDDLAVGAHKADHKTGVVFIFPGSGAGITTWSRCTACVSSFNRTALSSA